jgi:NADPH:quinone reductase-like Zn-dependent oxidoreductase
MGSKTLPSKMQAWQYTSAKGGLEKNLKLNSVAIPTPKPDQHLVRILATALNPVDYKPAELGLFSRLAIAKPATPGIDFVGRMVTPAAGSNLKPGELVFGFGSTSPFAGGCLKEYHAVPTIGTLPVPKGVEPLDAATIGVCGLTAYQSIIPHIKEGSRVFINGGSGGTGVFGIQIAKAAGCHVTTCCSTANVELCKSLGADEVIDYKKESVLEALKKQNPFDHVVDNVGHDYNLYWKAHEYSTSSAIFLEVAGALTLSSFMFVLKAKLLPGFLGGGKRPFVTIFAECKTDQLKQVGDWMAAGKVRAVIDETFSFERAPEAFKKQKTGRAKGKILVEGPSKAS